MRTALHVFCMLISWTYRVY